MSDSDSENLSDLEQEEAVSIDGSDAEKEDTKELSGELNDIEETDVKWSDLVSLIFHARVFVVFNKFFVDSLI